MIDALKLQQPSTKAQQDASNATVKENDLLQLDALLEARDFSNELQASMQTGVEVAAIDVPSELALELPTEILKQSQNFDTPSPKIFDPAITNGVEKLIGPESVEVETIKPEILQAMLKTSQVSGGRAPAIELTQNEIDPKLLNLEDFVEQKNLISKKLPTHAYGAKLNPVQAEALDKGLKETQVIHEVNTLEAPVNSQQFILNMMGEQTKVEAPMDVQGVSKVFDMSNIKTANSEEIINQISDYVVQARAAKEPTVNMKVHHDELGLLDITVSKSGANNEMVAINIGAHSLEGKNFFQLNSKELISHLAATGHNVSDFKLESPTQNPKNDFDQNSQFARNQDGNKQFGSEQNQRRHEQERRADLWKAYNQEVA